MCGDTPAGAPAGNVVDEPEVIDERAETKELVEREEAAEEGRLPSELAARPRRRRADSARFCLTSVGIEETAFAICESALCCTNSSPTVL